MPERCFNNPLRDFRPQKTYFPLSEGSKSLIITLFLFTELHSLHSIENITMLKKLPDHFNFQGSTISNHIKPLKTLSTSHRPASLSENHYGYCSSKMLMEQNLKADARIYFHSETLVQKCRSLYRTDINNLPVSSTSTTSTNIN